MTSSRIKANNRRRQRESRYCAEAALEARTIRLIDRHGRLVQMVDLTKEEIEEWKRREGVSFAPTLTRASNIAGKLKLKSLLATMLQLLGLDRKV